jgi:predicted Zn-dependent protease
MSVTLDRQSVLTRFDQLLAEPDASEVELALLGGRCVLTRFAQNEIHQNVEESRIVAHARTVVGRYDSARIAAMRTTDTSVNGLRSLIERGIELALELPPTPGFVGLPDHSDIPSDGVVRHDRQTASTGPAFRADQVELAVEHARRAGCHAAGYYRITEGSFSNYDQPGVFAIGNSWGLRQCDIRTAVDLMVSVSTPAGGNGWAVDWGTRRSDVDARATGERALEIARASERPERLETGRYTVLLEPAAVAELLGFVGPLFAAKAVQERRSVIASRSGGKLGSDLVTLTANPFDPRVGGCRFDGEGLITQPVVLLENGWHRGLTVGHSEADSLGRDANGYGPLQPDSSDSVPRNLVLSGGTGSVEELQARNPNCLRITRLWYTRYVDPRDARVTGMTRDGFFEFRGGQLIRALQNMRYNGSVLDMLSGVIDMSDPIRIGDMAVPAIVTDAFHVQAAAQ